jgi:DNA-binding transcriptional LysR family regulator
MDKLRALHYFIAAAEEGSLSGAARRMEVSVPSVAKLIGALERELGVRLVDRSTQGLKLTSQGEAYLDACRPLVEQLTQADAAAAVSARRVERTLAVGAPGLLSRLLLVPALPRFRERFPHVQIDLRVIDYLTVTDAQTRGLDVLVALGWPGSVSLVQRRLAQSRLIICASPAYWERHGVPSRPRDLSAHQCLLVRTPEGTVLDLWRHFRASEIDEVAVRGWLVSESRDYALQAVLGGQGVGRFADLSVWPLVRSAELLPVLTDWDCNDAPPFSALYRPEARRDVVVQGFVAFLADLLAEAESNCRQMIGARPTVTRPGWYSRQGRASRSGSAAAKSKPATRRE